MSGSDTVKGITRGMQSVAEGIGIRFSAKIAGSARNAKASLLPFGEILYRGESFEYTHGERPGYVEASFVLRVYTAERDGMDAAAVCQDWLHRLRGALNVGAINAAAFPDSKLVSRVTVVKASVDAKEGGLAELNMETGVRYREA